MTRKERMVAYTLYLLILLIGGVTLAALFLKALAMGPILLSSVSWNAGVV
jgi:hypothetical protein